MRRRWPVPVVVVALGVAACGSADNGAADVNESSVQASAPTSVVETTTSAPSGVTPSSTVTTTTTTTTTLEPVLAGTDAVSVAFTASAESTGYADRVAPLLVEHCASCHNPGGPGSTHWNLSTARDVVDVSVFIDEQLRSGAMPPWPASDIGVPYADSLALTDDELADILDWIDAGSRLDVDSATSMIGGPIAAIREPLVIPPLEPYGGESGRYDDYRCLVYDPELTDGAWLRGHQFVADQTAVVHHAIGYIVPAAQREAASLRDAAEPGSGWECYGGTGLADDRFVMGWAPGQLPEVYPDGFGLWLEPGDFFVIQVHYHYDTRPGPDSSHIELSLASGDLALEPVTISQYLTPAEIPCGPGESGPLCDREAVAAMVRAEYGVVPADFINMRCGVTPTDFAHMTGGTAWSTCDLPVSTPGEIVSVLGHMHDLGATYRMTLNPDTPDELVLLDIPDWDYDWQYNYRPAESIVIKPGDTVRFECSWERSRRDQSLEPAYVLWSFGSDDEMCFSTIVTRPVD